MTYQQVGLEHPDHPDHSMLTREVPVEAIEVEVGAQEVEDTWNEETIAANT